MKPGVGVVGRVAVGAGEESVSDSSLAEGVVFKFESMAIVMPRHGRNAIARQAFAQGG